MAWTKPRLLITVATTVSLTRVPDSRIARASTASSWSPSTTVPVASTASTRSASPSTAKPTSAPCSTTALRSGSRWVEPQPSLMFSPSGSAWMAITSAPAARSACGPTTAAAPSAQSSTTFTPSRGRDRVPVRCRGVVVHGGVVRRDPADVTPDRALPLLPQLLLDRDLDGVVELVAAAGEELDAVVGHRVVRGREHHAEVGAERAGEVGDAGGRQDAEQEHVDARRGEAGDDRSLEELPGDAGVAAYHGQRAVPGERAALGEDMGRRNGEVQGQLSGQLTVGQAPDPVRAEESRHATRLYAVISAC